MAHIISVFSVQPHMAMGHLKCGCIEQRCSVSINHTLDFENKVKNECKMNPVGRVIRPEGETSIDCNGDTKGLLRY